MISSANSSHLLLVGRVGVDITAEGVDRNLRNMEYGPIDVTIRSDGGDFKQAAAIYNRLCEVNENQGLTINICKAHSAAVWIMFAADIRRIARNGSVMIHNVRSGSTYGQTPTELREQATVLDGMSKLIGDITASRADIEREVVFELMENEIVMNATRAFDLGFATEIIKPIY